MVIHKGFLWALPSSDLQSTANKNLWVYRTWGVLELDAQNISTYQFFSSPRRTHRGRKTEFRMRNDMVDAYISSVTIPSRNAYNSNRYELSIALVLLALTLFPIKCFLTSQFLQRLLWLLFRCFTGIYFQSIKTTIKRVTWTYWGCSSLLCAPWPCCWYLQPCCWCSGQRPRDREQWCLGVR
jgi:hypothetical protein